MASVNKKKKLIDAYIAREVIKNKLCAHWKGFLFYTSSERLSRKRKLQKEISQLLD